MKITTAEESKISGKTLFKDIIGYLPARLVPALLTLAALPLVTRLFPPSDYGNYALALAALSALSALSGWTPIAILRFYPAYEKQGKGEFFTGQILKLTFGTVLCVAALSFCILGLLKNHLPAELGRLLALALAVFVPASIFAMLLEFLRIKRKIAAYSALSIWKSVTALGFGVLLAVSFRMGAQAMLWGLFLSLLLALPFAWRAGIGPFSVRDLKISPAYTREMAAYTLPLTLGNLAVWILSLSDRYILNLFRGPQEVGIYSVSYQISEQSIMLFASLFSFAFSPLSVMVWEKEGLEKTQRFMTQGTRYFLLLCLPVTAGMAVLSRPILELLSTPQYFEGTRIFPLVVAAAFLEGLVQRYGAGLSFYKKTRLQMWAWLLAGAANVGLNLLLVPRYGYIAAAVTTLLSYGLLLALTVSFSRRYFIWNFPFRSLANALLASLVMGAAVHVMASAVEAPLFSILTGTAAGAAVYLMTLYVLREYLPAEKEAVKTFLKVRPV